MRQTEQGAAARMPVVFGSRLSHWLRAYYLGPDHPMKIRLWILFRRLLGYPRLKLPYANGGWITLVESDYLQRHIMMTGDYETEVWEALSRHATRDEVLWDVGAHIGVVALKALLDERVKQVHAFEPNPEARAVLAHNVRLNRGHCVIHPLALDQVAGTRRLHLAPVANTGLASFKTSFSSRVVEVACRTADELVFDDGIPAPTLMKIDVEDWELPVLLGARRLLRERPPTAFVLEAPSDQSGALGDREVAALLRSLGYTTSRIPRSEGHIEVRENYLIRPGAWS